MQFGQQIYNTLTIKARVQSHGSELQGQEGTKCIPPTMQNTTTTVSHLHDRIISQFLNIASYFKICMTKLNK